ncbi:MAG: uracil-DNA glycosylase [Candidatus Acidiferrales bacterium]|jgi:uracil-DNA glycosylase family 4
MDPAKRASLGARSEVRDDARTETRLEEQVKDWLRYGEDLGLAPYYRDRAPLHAITESGAAAPEESQSIATSSDISAALPESVPAMMAAAASGRAPAAPIHVASSASQKPAPVATILPAAAPSLFESIERIEGDTLPRIREDIGDCTRCKLHKGRTKIVFGTGNPNADLMFVGEGPGRDEDLSGEPFVGRAGKLLTDMIKAMGLQREDVYIANVVKCRPPENRLPEKDEITTCSPFLMRQIDAIKPKVICTLGSCSAQTLLQTAQGISKLRGEWFDFRGAKLMPTYHPAYLLRNPAAKPEVWKDLQKVMAVLGLQPKKR